MMESLGNFFFCCGNNSHIMGFYNDVFFKPFARYREHFSWSGRFQILHTLNYHFITHTCAV